MALSSVQNANRERLRLGAPGTPSSTKAVYEAHDPSPIEIGYFPQLPRIVVFFPLLSSFRGFWWVFTAATITMEFEKRKAATLSSLTSTEPDKSPKGTLDIPIIPLINALNHNPSYFTTSSSSRSGRISILSQPLQNDAVSSIPGKKARGGTWLFVSQDPADPDSVFSLLFPSETTQCPVPSELVFRFEPLIIAVECRDLSSAQSLVSLAISCGFRESGITSAGKRVIIAIRCSIRLEVPLGDTRKIMVTPEYVRYLVQVANVKMEANRKRTEKFLEVLQHSNGFGGSVVADNGNHLSPKV